MPPSRRLQAGAVLFGAVMTMSLSLAPAPSWGWRLLTGCACMALGWRSAGAILFQRGRAAVRRFEWADDGRWRVLDPQTGWIRVRLATQTAALGPWILLVWEVDREHGRARRRRYALIDGAAVSQKVFRALRGRLTLSARQADPKVRGHDNC